MRVARTDKSLTAANLVIDADSADLEPIKRHVLAHFRHSVKIPGFRAGSAPMALVEKNIDQKVFLDEFMEHALNQLYKQAVHQEHLQPVGQPNVQLKKFVPFTQLQFEVETESIGKITVADYKKIKIPKEAVNITAKEVNDILRTLQERAAERQEVDGPAKMGNEVIIDFDGKGVDGKPVAGAAAKDHPLILGSGTFIPGFEENLAGSKSGQNKQFKVKFPRDYGVASLQNRDVTFDVSVKKVNQLQIPKADDKFASQLGPFKTIAELKTDVKKQLKLERETQAEQERTNKIVGEIVAHSKVEIPASLIEEEINRLEDEEKRNLTYRGQTWQEHLAEEGITAEQHRERQKPQAEERIKGGLVLSEIATAEGISVSPEELDERIKLLRGQYQDQAMQAELEKPQARRDIEARLLTEKTIHKLSEYSRKA